MSAIGIHRLSAAALLVMAGVAGIPAGARAEGLPLTRIAEVGAALQACWMPPPGAEGSRITFRFGLNTRGELKGTPRATYSRLTGDLETQRAFVAAALRAFSLCTPVAMSAELGRIVAARVLTITYALERRPRDVNI